jgi:uncharacterized protein (DUF58 family)
VELFDETFLKKLEYLHIVSRKVFAGRARAERRGKRIGAGIEFADHRDYYPGDDVRYLDWGVYGRLDKLLLRLFEEEEDLYIYILVDTSASMARPPVRPGVPSKLDYARRLAAALCYLGLANLDRVSIASFQSHLEAGIAPARGKARIFGILEHLRQLEPGRMASGTATSLAQATSELVRKNRRPGLCAVISDFYDLRYEAGLNLLRYHRFEPYALQVLAHEDVAPELRGDIERVDCETGEAREVTVTPRLLADYRRAHEAHCAALDAFCKRIAVPLFRAETDLRFEDLVLRIFRAGGFLR